MQIYELKTGNGIELGEKIKPVSFGALPNPNRKNSNAIEKDLEKLIIENPTILNDDKMKLLIIDSQTGNKVGGRQDILAIDQNGNLVTVEIKRDISDADQRSETFECQALRYAASNRTMTIDEIVSTFAHHLKKDFNAEDKTEALNLLCQHIVGRDDEKVTPDNIAEYIIPEANQVIMLVAAGFSRSCLSACAWLQENGIDIRCIQLQPFKSEEKKQYYLVKTQILPTTELKDYFIKMKQFKDNVYKQKNKAATTPLKLYIAESEAINCKTWVDVMVSMAKYALEQGATIETLRKAGIACAEVEEDKKNWNPTQQGSTTEIIEYKNKQLEISSQGSTTEKLNRIIKLQKYAIKGEKVCLDIELKNGPIINSITPKDVLDKYYKEQKQNK